MVERPSKEQSGWDGMQNKTLYAARRPPQNKGHLQTEMKAGKDIHHLNKRPKENLMAILLSVNDFRNKAVKRNERHINSQRIIQEENVTL